MENSTNSPIRKKISFVFPVMNEEENVISIHKEIKSIKEISDYDLEFIFVCDPSRDKTAINIKSLANSNSEIKGIFLAERAGQYNCIRAGLKHANGDCAITMDVDFQDPPELIPKMIAAWELGNKIVHTRRTERKADKFLYRNFVGLGYRILHWLTDGRVSRHVGDFRLIDKSALEIILMNGDPNPFWRGISSLTGLSSATLDYSRPARRSGETKYGSFIGSPTVGLRGLASFSIKPLLFLQTVGFIAVLIAFFSSISMATFFVFSPEYPKGIPTIIVLISIFFGVQFFSTAVIATYLIVLVEQTRRRPDYLISEQINIQKSNSIIELER